MRKDNCCTYWLKGWWNDSCCQHDKNYYSSIMSRLQADNALFKSVVTSLDHKTRLFRVFSLPIATIMWIGVRIGGRWRYIRKQSGADDR